MLKTPFKEILLYQTLKSYFDWEFETIPNDLNAFTTSFEGVFGKQLVIRLLLAK